MKRARTLTDPEALDAVSSGGTLPGETAHYLTAVLRLPVGAVVELGDGTGRLLVGELARRGRDWWLQGADWRSGREAAALGPPITLMAALLKPARWRLLLEKSVELGVVRLLPIISEHTAIRPSPASLPKLVERWRRVAREAAKQSRRTVATEIDAPLRFTRALAEAPAGKRLIAALQAEGPEEPEARLDPHALEGGGAATLLVGPEGGWSRDEVAAAVAAGFTRVSLGAHPLRAETAAIVLVSLLRYGARVFVPRERDPRGADSGGG